MSEIEKTKWLRQVVGAVVMAVLIAGVRYGCWLYVPDSELTPLIALYAVLGIWLGAWGVLAVYVGDMMGFMPFLGLDVAALQSVSAVFAALIPAWAFRHFKGDPRIKTVKDALLFLLFGVFLGSLTSTLIGSSVRYIYGIIPNVNVLIYVVIPGWFLSNMIFTFIFDFPLLKALSGSIIRVQAYCKGWFS